MTDAITYEDIYELLRAEKNSADLEKLDAKYLSNVKDYIAAKRKLLERQKGGMFSGLKERAKILTEIENVRVALKDLFERRERKVINRALYTLRTELKMKDTTNMLAHEAELYNILLANLEKSKLAFSSLVGEATDQYESICDDAVSPPKPQTQQPVEEYIQNNTPNTEQDTNVRDYKEKASTDINLEFLENVPELVDANLKKHGPFMAGEIESMPSELAQILIAQGKAKEVL